MTGNPLHAANYADQAIQQKATVVANEPVARDIFRLRIACPEIAPRILPGQFVMLRLTGTDDPLIGRAFALYDTLLSSADIAEGIEVVYLVKGKFTRRLRGLGPGLQLDIWGPLGNGFAVQAVDHLILVAGGIGQTPFVAVAQEALGLRQYGSPPRQAPKIPRVTLCFGARSADQLAGVEDFQRLGVDVQVATEDGSRGHCGLVTDVLLQVLRDTPSTRSILCCGPERMMEAVARIAAHDRIPCAVSLESPMACGIGICFSCVVRIADDAGAWDYRRSCVEGPVFDATRVRW